MIIKQVKNKMEINNENTITQYCRVTDLLKSIKPYVSLQFNLAI